MVAIIHAEPWDRDRRLRELGSTREDWIEVVQACVAARGYCTNNDPKSAPGYMAWRAGVRRMREIFRPQGWEKEDLDGVETIVHPGRKIRITVTNTDAGTTDPNRSPRNRTVKGPATERIIDLNNQIEMFPHENLGNVSWPNDGYSMWNLCVFDNGNVVRAELSRPIEFRSGYFIKFSERIWILGPGDWDEFSLVAPEDDAGPDFQIEVRRK